MQTTTSDALSVRHVRVPSFPNRPGVAALEIETVSSPTCCVARLRGFASPATQSAVEAELHRAVAAKPAVFEVHLDHTEQIVASVMGALVGAVRTVMETGGRACLVNPQRHVRQMLDRMRLGDVLAIEMRQDPDQDVSWVSPHGRRGFTLVELLVVISIISVLIAILLPAIGKARHHAVTTQCLSNGRQIGVTAFAVAADREGYFVPSVLNGSGVAVQTGIPRGDFDLYRSYGLVDATWSCPGRRFKTLDDPAVAHVNHTYQYFAGAKRWFNYQGLMAARSPTRTDDSTSRKTLMADSTLANNGAWGDPTQAIAEDLPVHGRQPNGSPVGGNHLFADGSGAWVRFEKMQVLTSWWLPQRTFYFYQQDVPAPFVSHSP